MDKLGLMPVPRAGTQAAGISVNKVKSAEGSGFGDILKESVQAVNGEMQNASSLSKGLMAGEHSNIQETMIAMEKASISFHMLTRVQGKVIDAYKEIMRMQL
ncbi:MAG: flagellar hook-basal body complex protein FliE [Deltaproteobacteria bacterium]|nr:flagellar hook-basal body complex protein FliE [Deltaproteobacteria bacterium]